MLAVRFFRLFLALRDPESGRAWAPFGASSWGSFGMLPGTTTNTILVRLWLEPLARDWLAFLPAFFLFFLFAMIADVEWDKVVLVKLGSAISGIR